MGTVSKSNKLYLPFKLIMGYILLTIAVNFWGPWEYRDYNKWIIVGFMGIFGLVCLAGYKKGVYADIAHSNYQISKRFLLRLHFVALCIVLAIHSIGFVSSLRDAGPQSVLDAIINIGATYAATIAAASKAADVSTLGQLRTLFGLFTQFAVIGGMFWYKELRFSQRVMFFGLLSILLLDAIMFKGTQKPFGDLITYYLSVKIIQERFANQSRLWLILFVAVGFSLLVFGYMQTSRMQLYYTDALRLSTHPSLILNSAHPIFAVFGLTLGGALAVTVLYFSMGYYGLSLSLQQSFVWTYGLGNSFALSSYAEQYFGIPSMLFDTYPFRVQYATSWPALTYWQTIFPWLASDLTFVGVILLFGVISYIYAVAWREATEQNNVLSVLLFANFNIMWLFVPSNNQLMQTRESTIAVIMLAVCWLLFHKRLNSTLTVTQRDDGRILTKSGRP